MQLYAILKDHITPLQQEQLNMQKEEMDMKRQEFEWEKQQKQASLAPIKTWKIGNKTYVQNRDNTISIYDKNGNLVGKQQLNTVSPEKAQNAKAKGFGTFVDFDANGYADGEDTGSSKAKPNFTDEPYDVDENGVPRDPYAQLHHRDTSKNNVSLQEKTKMARRNPKAYNRIMQNISKYGLDANDVDIWVDKKNGSYRVVLRGNTALGSSDARQTKSAGIDDYMKQAGY